MISSKDVLETIKMIDEEYLDVRTITMGISLLDCADADIDRSCEKIYRKITTMAKDLVKVGNDIGREYGIPIINKRISVTPIAMLVGVSGGDPLKYALTLEKCCATDRRGFHRRLQRPCAEGLFRRRQGADRSHPAGHGADRSHLRFGQCGQHEGRHQHGRGAHDGRCGEEGERADRGAQLHRFGEDRRLLQCA